MATITGDGGGAAAGPITHEFGGDSWSGEFDCDGLITLQFEGGNRWHGLLNERGPDGPIYGQANVSGTNTWGLVGRVFHDSVANNTIFAYTLLNNALTPNISSFHILNNGSMGTGAAPAGWSFSQTGAWWSWETTNPIAFGAAVAGSLGNFSVTVDDLVPVVFNGTFTTVSDGESTTVVGCPNCGQWMVASPGGPVPARPRLAGDHVGVAVVLVEHPEGIAEVGRVVLRLAVRSHDALEAADRHLVLGRHGARGLEGGPAGQHHRGLRRHHQNAAIVGQHGGEGVEVALCSHVDAVEKDVDHAARLREGDDAADDASGGVEVLGAAVHRDPGAARDRHPLDRNAERALTRRRFREPHDVVRALRMHDHDAVGRRFKEVAENYVERHVKAKGLRSKDEIERVLEVYVYPAWQDRTFIEITRTDVTALLDAVEDNAGPRQADYVLAVVRGIMNWYASRTDDYTPKIARGMRRTDPASRKRARILDDDELREYQMKLRSPGTVGALMHLAYQRQHPKAKESNVRKLIRGTNFLEALAKLVEEEDDASPPDEALKSLPARSSSDRRPRSKAASSGTGSTTSSDQPEADPSPTTTTESDTSSDSPPISLAS